MRRWQLFTAFALAAVLCAPAAGAETSEDNRPTIASGLLVDGADHPVAGNVELLAWPTGRPVQIGETVNLVPVGHVRTGEDGRFSVKADATPELAELAGLNGGYLNLELRVSSAGVNKDTQFSRYLVDERFEAQGVHRRKDTRAIEWRAAPDEPTELVRVTLGDRREAGRTPDGTAIYPMQGGCTDVRKIDSQIGETVIGELRTPPDTKTASFVYGKQADSEISIAARGTNGPWEFQGSHHIGNARGGVITQGASGGEHLVIRTRFVYDKFQYTCPSGRREKIVPREWLGDVMAAPVPERGCMNAPQERLGRYGRDSQFERDRERAVQWAGAATIFGAGLSARSGYSERVHARWEFGSEPLHLLCGDDAAPWKAKHVFAGNSA